MTFECQKGSKNPRYSLRHVIDTVESGNVGLEENAPKEWLDILCFQLAEFFNSNILHTIGMLGKVSS